jgi:hypothetical protein
MFWAKVANSMILNKNLKIELKKVSFSLRKWIIVMFIPIFFNGCKNELDVFTNDSEYMVVYGFLDLGRNTQVIRISKVFLNTGQTVEDVANNADSIYYDNLNVVITEFPSQRRIVFNKTDTIPKAQGFFTNDKHVLYVSDEPLSLDRNVTYQLSIENPETGYQVKGKTTIVHRPVITNPVSQFSNELTFVPIGNLQLRFTTYDNAAAFEAYFDFEIIEYPLSDTTQKTSKIITWRFYNETIRSPSNQQIIKQLPGEGFFQFLASRLQPEEGILRRFGKVKMRHYSGSVDLKDFLEASKPSIGIVQKQTEYTNMENANGVFSSIYSFERDSLYLDELSVLNVRSYNQTSNLNFQWP